MRKAVAYYRSRPSEPEASDLALRLQREAVRAEIEQCGLTLIGEYVEREGESETECYPAYAAAAHMAGGQAEFVVFIIASRAAIGSGEPFEPPNIDFGMLSVVDEHGFVSQGYITSELMAPSVQHASEITLPDGAPGPLCLYAEFRPRQLDTLVYLCNATSEALLDVVVTTESISMHQFFNSEADEWWERPGGTYGQRWDAVPPGACVQVSSLNHIIWDMVCRYRLTYADAAGQHWAAEAHDLSLNACQLAQDPDKVWVAFSQAATADQAALGDDPEESS